MRSLGVDVSEKRGLDVVLLDGSPQPLVLLRRVTPEGLASLIAEWRPDVIAIDSPPAWSNPGRTRDADRALLRLGIHAFWVPSDASAADKPHLRWMERGGFVAFKIAEQAGYPRYRRGPVKGTAIEVFPHASAVVLSNGLPPTGWRKKDWRAAVLKAHGLDVAGLVTLDLVDAALAALTGLRALEGQFTAVGDPDEGVIVLPSKQLPLLPYPRCVAAPRSSRDRQGGTRSACQCGDPECRALTRQEFAPGHDAKRKALLWQRARAGREALAELERRRWELPPEMRRRPQR